MLLYLLLSTLIVLCLISFINRTLKRQKFQKNYEKVFFRPPTAHPFFGHSNLISSTKEVLSLMTTYFDKYGKNLHFVIGPSWCNIFVIFCTSDYKFIECILKSNKTLRKATNYMYLRHWLGNGLLLSYGKYWHTHRKILTPAFHFDILKQFIPIFESLGDTLVETLEKYDGNPSFDIHPIVTLYTLDVISETAMGTKINAQSGKNPEYVQSVKEMLQLVINRCLSPLKLTPYTFWMTKDYWYQKSLLKTLHSFTRKVIKSKMTQTSESSGKRPAFLDLLLKYRKDGAVFTDEEIREEVDTFMFEGHDTTSAGICYTMLCLGDNPEVQRRAYEEQIDLFGGEKNPEMTYSDLQNMKYLDSVIKETFRLFPPVPVLGRYITEELDFENCTIPPGAELLFSIYNLHRNPEHFPDPEKFDPDRFNSIDGTLPYAYIPFSAGQRNCIGQKFAMLEVKSALSKIIRNFEITKSVPEHKLQLSVEAVLKSQNGIKIGLKKRN